ncbi:hypothetical protein [Nocardiopsis rhodophaea]
MNTKPTGFQAVRETNLGVLLHAVRSLAPGSRTAIAIATASELN